MLKKRGRRQEGRRRRRQGVARRGTNRRWISGWRRPEPGGGSPGATAEAGRRTLPFGIPARCVRHWSRRCPTAEPGCMAGLDRLSASDLLTMQSAQAGWPMDIGVVAVFDGGALVDADGRFRIEAVRETVGRRLRRVPRFRQVLHVPPRLSGPPVWVDAPTVDLTRHVQVGRWLAGRHRAAPGRGGGTVEPAARPRGSALADVVPARARGRPGRDAAEGAPRDRRRGRGDGAARRVVRPGRGNGPAGRRPAGRARADAPAPCCATSSAGCGRS